MLLSTYGIFNFINNDDEIEKNKEKQNDIEKMYNIIMIKGNIYNDQYNRTVSYDVAKKFYKIAKKYSINIDNVTDDEFDFIYKKYVKQMIKKYDN